MTRDEYLLLKNTNNIKNIQNNSFRTTIITEEGEVYQPDISEPLSLNLNSTLTEHPLVNGDTIGDHMYRENITCTLRGSFSLNGNKPTLFKGTSKDRLKNIQEVFERINKEAIVCDIVMQNKLENSEERFIRRRNMVLTSISWTENQNYLDFTFTFNEIMFAELQTENYNVTYEDENLPAITDGVILSFSEDVLDMNVVDEIILNVLRDNKLVTDEFLQKYVEENKSSHQLASNIAWIVSGISFGVVVATTATTALLISAGVLAASSAGGPIGLIIGAGLATLIAAGVGIWQAIEAGNAQRELEEAQRTYGVEQFKLYQDDREREAEFERFTNYFGNIHNTLLTLNNHISVYGFNSNQNQDCFLVLDDTNYIFSFFRNSKNKNYSLKIYQEGNEKPEVVVNDIRNNAKTNIFECTNSNAILKTYNNGYRVYIISNEAILTYDEKRNDEVDESKLIQVPDKPNRDDYLTDNEYFEACKNWTIEVSEIEKQNSKVYEEARQEKLNLEMRDLRRYQIIVTDQDMDKFRETLEEVIITGMRKY